MRKLIFWLLKFYVNDYKSRIKISSILQEGVKREYYEQTGYGCLYEGVGEYIEACETFKTGNVYIIKSGISNQVDISYNRIK